MIRKPLRNLMVFVPTAGEVDVRLVPRLMKWQEKGATINFSSVPFVDNARNVACRHFLASKKKYLLFVDSDVIPEENAPERLIKSKKDIVGGWYNLVMGPNVIGAVEIRPSAFVTYKDGSPLYESQAIMPKSGLIEVMILSGGLLLISRKVLEGMDDPWFEIRWLQPQHISWEGEDVNFSRKAREKGFTIWCDTDVFAPHNKTLLI